MCCLFSAVQSQRLVKSDSGGHDCCSPYKQAEDGQWYTKYSNLKIVVYKAIKGSNTMQFQQLGRFTRKFP